MNGMRACPHKMEMVIEEWSADNVPKIACDAQENFSLVDLQQFNGEDYSIATYPVKIVEGEVMIGFE
jgi:nitrite reductase (NADH) small subunit